jgi:hypothetical protein
MTEYSRVDSKFYALLSLALHAGGLSAYRSVVYMVDFCWTSEIFWKLSLVTAKSEAILFDDRVMSNKLSVNPEDG